MHTLPEEFTWSEDRKKTIDYPYIEALVPVRLYVGTVRTKEGGRKGFSLFKSFSTEVRDGEGQKVGIIGGGTGAVTLSTKEFEGELFLRHEDFWHMAHKILEEGQWHDPLMEDNNG